MTAQEDKGEKRQLIVILVHGTWSTSERWTRDGSEFKEGLQAGLTAHYSGLVLRTHRPVLLPDLWKARERTANEPAADSCRRSERVASEYLMIGHGYGDNNATLAPRQLMKDAPGFPVRAAICLKNSLLKPKRQASRLFLYL